jgi:hypothetical protein
MPDAKLKPAAEVIAEWYPGKRNSGVLKSHAAKLQADRAAVRADERERVLDAVRERILSEPEMAETREERLGATLGSNILISMVQPHLDAIRKGEE